MLLLKTKNEPSFVLKFTYLVELPNSEALEEVTFLEETVYAYKVFFESQYTEKWIKKSDVKNWTLIEDYQRPNETVLALRWYHVTKKELSWDDAVSLTLFRSYKLPTLQQLRSVCTRCNRAFSESFYWTNVPYVAYSLYSEQTYNRKEWTAKVAYVSLV